MKIPFKKYFRFSALLIIVLHSIAVPGIKNGKQVSVPEKASAYYEMLRSNISNHDFYITNFGTCGFRMDVPGSGWFWPRGSKVNYIYGGGLWFGANKNVLTNGADSLIKVVTVGYNPNSAVGWFAPGSIDDGPDALENSDPRSAKYILYRSTDYDANGKCVSDPLRPDWPIRWKNSSKTPGKKGYYGDYIADPLERKEYPPVVISQEDFFCIYKDTDVRRNPEFTAGKGYPLGIEVEQTFFTWGGNKLNDVVISIYSVKNKSGDTLKNCFFGPALDPDIGTAENDRTSFYFKDTTLELGYQFSEYEGSIRGVLGFKYLESPVISSPADSLRYYTYTGRAKKIGEQTGMTTFRNWTIETDPYGTVSRYDFLASGKRDSVSAAGDKRVLCSTGPFTMAPGDTARIVLSTMITFGIGELNNTVPEQNGYLDSLIALAKFAQLQFESDRFAEFPSAEASTDILGDLAEISMTVNGTVINAKSVSVTLKTSANDVAGQGALHDDGAHNDGAAGDRIFGGTIAILAQPLGLHLNALITDENNNAVEWNRLVTGITTTVLKAGKPVIVSDNLNSDGLVNVGEGFRFAIPLVKQNGFSYPNLSVSLKTVNSATIASLNVSLLSSDTHFIPLYNPTDPKTFFEYWVSSNSTETSLQFHVRITDASGNNWNDSVEIEIHPFQLVGSPNQRLQGRTSLAPFIAVVDKGAVQNHSYVVRGTDSADVNKTIGFTVKDSTSGTILINNNVLDYSGVYGFTTPVVDGFKVLWSGTYASTMKIDHWKFTTSNSLQFPWFSTASSTGPFANTANNRISDYAIINSDLNYGDYRDVQVRFSKRTSFTDQNGNGMQDSGEPYGFDSSNTVRSQRAYFYRKANVISFTPWQYSGFKSVPFAAYDIESGVPRQLDIIVTKIGPDGQWDFDPTKSSGLTKKYNFIYIMPTTYDPDGTHYDSTKGGMNFIPVLNRKKSGQFYWKLWLVTNGSDPFMAEGDVDLYSTRPFSSRDAFLFNPSITSIQQENGFVPDEYTLSQNYPNPFNPATTIQYSLKQPSTVSLKIYNILGQLVKTLVAAQQNAGRYTIRWDGMNEVNARVSTGLYFYRLEAGNFSEVKKMMFIQ